MVLQLQKDGWTILDQRMETVAHRKNNRWIPENVLFLLIKRGKEIKFISEHNLSAFAP